MAWWVARNNVQWEGRLPEMSEMEKEIGVAWVDPDVALRDIKRAVEAAKPGELVVIPRAWGRGLSVCELLTRP